MSRERQSTQRKNQGYATYQGKKAPMGSNRNNNRQQQPYRAMSVNVTVICILMGLLMGFVHGGAITGTAVSLASSAVACLGVCLAYHFGRVGK